MNEEVKMPQETTERHPRNNDGKDLIENLEKLLINQKVI